MKRGWTGQYGITAKGNETVRSFVPAPPDPALVVRLAALP